MKKLNTTQSSIKQTFGLINIFYRGKTIATETRENNYKKSIKWYLKRTKHEELCSGRKKYDVFGNRLS